MKRLFLIALALCGCDTINRVRSGNVPLGGLPLGKWRYLRPDENF